MAETEVATPPPVPTEEPIGKNASEKREGRPERPKREPEEVPDMTVEEAQKALNALPKVCMYVYTDFVGCRLRFDPPCGLCVRGACPPVVDLPYALIRPRGAPLVRDVPMLSMLREAERCAVVFWFSTRFEEEQRVGFGFSKARTYRTQVFQDFNPCIHARERAYLQHRGRR